MEEEKKHSHLQPLIIPSSISSSHSLHQHNHHYHDPTKHFNSDTNIVIRIIAILLVALISLWANFMASKTFDITILNDTQDSPSGRRFSLSYVSNDKATRILLNTSSFVENLFYPNNNNDKNNHHHFYPKKHIDSVTLRLARRNLNTTVAVYTAENHHHYVIEISPVLFEDKMYDKIAIVGAILRGMAKVWLWDGAPQGVIDGMAEYAAEMAGFRRDVISDGGDLPECEEGHGWWWEDKDPTHVARLLHYCEKFKKGFIQRLNEAMRDTWHDRVADEVLGMPIMKLCAFYKNSNASWVGSIDLQVI